MSKILRKKRDNPYLTIDKTALNDKRLSWQAKGLHAYLMGLPDDWQIYVSDLAKRAKNGRDSVLGIMKELEKNGYLEASQGRNEKGSFKTKDFVVHEIPMVIQYTQSLGNKESNPRPENPPADNPAAENASSENPELVNNELTKKGNNQENKAAALGQPSQESEVLGEAQTVPAAAFPSANALDAKAESTAQDGVIAERLTKKQYQYAAQLATELNSANPSLGVTTEGIEVLLLDRKRFSMAGRDFFRKLNTIRAQALKGNFTSPGLVHKATVQIDEKVQAQKADDDALAKLLADKHSLNCALRSKVAQLSPVLAQSHRSAIAVIDSEIDKLNPHAVVGHGHDSTSMQKDSQLIDVPALAGSACGNDMCSSSFGSATSLSNGGVS